MRRSTARSPVTNAATLRAIVADLLPTCVTVTASCGDQAPTSLHPAEELCILDAGPQRRRDFTYGRTLARSALSMLGFVDVPILSGEMGAPRWPPGVVGTISHCDHLCVAALTSQRHIIGMGVDIERAAPLDPMLCSHVCTPREIAALKDLGNEELWAKVSFSAKESIYKCFYPLVRRFIEFDEVEITLDVTRGIFTAYPLRSDLRFPSEVSFSGRFHSVGGYVYTAAVLTTALSQTS